MERDENQPSTSRKKVRLDKQKPCSDEQLLKMLENSSDEFDESDEDFDIENEVVSDSEGWDDSNILTAVQTTAAAPAVPLWLPERPQVTQIPFRGNTGLKAGLDAREPLDYFNLLFDDHFFQLVVENTNSYAVEILVNSTSDQSRITRWKDVTKEEFRTFLGLFFHMGTIKINRINDYWRTHYLFNLPSFAKFMSRNRFLLILRALHFNDNSVDGNQLSKITPLVTFFNSKMAQIYYPQKELAIDESMVQWSGRLSFRQYMKGKRHKYGIKLYCLAEPKGMTQKIHVYGGSSDATVGGKNHVQKVVHTLLEGKKGIGHSVYMDNFYNSVELSERLLAEKTYITGTLRPKRIGNPTEVISKKLRKGETYCLYSNQGLCVSKWMDNKEVLTISTEHSGEMVETVSKKQQRKFKPQTIAEYNKFMGGIDNGDQMMSYYACLHKTLRWYKKLGLHIFQMMFINSYYLYNKYGSRKMNLYDFRLVVLEKLLPSPPEPQNERQLRQHYPQNCERGQDGKTKRRRCKYCWDNRNVRKATITFCPQCPTEPGLCLDSCYRLFHERL